MTAKETLYRGRPAWIIDGEALSITVMRTGCHLASLHSPSDSELINPLWNPQWPSGDPATAASTGTWGTGEHAVEAPLLASICGSNLCADRFGAPHPGEVRPLHGEAGVVEWALAPGQPDAAGACTFTATLPHARLRVSRTFILSGSTVTVTSALEDASGAPRDVEVCEHTTLGGAFLDGVAAVEASVDAGAEMTGGEDAPEVAPAEVLRVPAPGDPPAGSVRTLRVAPSERAWWAATNSARGWRLRATWARSDFPWLCVWTEHKKRTHAPWAGRERTRGMEVSTKPFPEGAPPSSRADEFLGAPTRVTLPAGGRTTRSITLAWERV